MIWVCIALGGALGSISRYAIGLALACLETFPFGTLTANAIGSLIIGVAAGFWAMDQRKTPTSLFIITGFFGGFNTFSTSSLKTIGAAPLQTSPPPSPSASPLLGWAIYLRNRSKTPLLKRPTTSQLSCEPVS